MNKLTSSNVGIMVALTKGMYTKVWNRESNTYTGSKAFGLSDGQCGNDEAAHNGGWYNQKGEKLGWGDLSYAQLLRISQEIAEGEVFYVLPEGASHWDFVRWSKDRNDMSYTIAPDAQAPGIEYVQAKCKWVIKRGSITRVSDYQYEKVGEQTYKGVTYTSVKRTAV